MSRTLTTNKVALKLTKICCTDSTVHIRCRKEYQLVSQAVNLLLQRNLFYLLTTHITKKHAFFFLT